jgi:anti-sigma factor RsiW
VNCWRVENLVAPFLDGDLPEAETESIADHLRSCLACSCLVEELSALPDFPRIAIDPGTEEELMDALTSQIQDRIASPQAETQPRRAAGAAQEGIFWSLLRGDLRVPAALAGAYLALVVLLAGGIALNHQRVEALEDSLAERDRLIQTLSTRLAASEATVVNPFEVATNPELVFMPASGPASVGLGPSLVLQPRGQLRMHPGATARGQLPYRLISNETPRVVH